MNTLESYTSLSPFGKEEECAKFTIDDTSTPFVLSEIMTAGRQYTLSFWIRSDVTGSMEAAGTTFETDGEWKSHAVVFVADGGNLKITFGSIGTYYIYHSQLEIGNKTSDWVAAPEDSEKYVDQNVAEIRESVAAQYTSLANTCESILLKALVGYTEKSSFEEYKQLNSAELELLAKQLSLKFTETVEQIKQVDSDLQKKYNTITTYFDFGVDGLTIGTSDSPIKTVQSNDRYSMLVNDVEVLWLDPDGNSNIPFLKVTQVFDMLGYVATKDDEGRVNVVCVGG